MNALDSNVLLRFLVRDAPAQSQAASRIVHGAIHTEQPLFISVPVLCETVWVLQRRYKLGRDVICSTITALLDSAAFELAYPEQVQDAVAFFERGRAGFADYLIGTLAQARGCDHTYTFDRKLRGADGFKVI